MSDQQSKKAKSAEADRHHPPCGIPFSKAQSRAARCAPVWPPPTIFSINGTAKSCQQGDATGIVNCFRVLAQSRSSSSQNASRFVVAVGLDWVAGSLRSLGETPRGDLETMRGLQCN
jgi:hypothetical protein